MPAVRAVLDTNIFVSALLGKGPPLMIRPKDRIDVCRDPSDDLVLECAVSGKADWVVTGDQDLLVLHPYRGIGIVSPKEFLKRIPQ